MHYVKFIFKVIHLMSRFIDHLLRYLLTENIVLAKIETLLQRNSYFIATITTAFEVVINVIYILGMWKVRLEVLTCLRQLGCQVELGLSTRSFNFNCKSSFHFLLVKHVKLVEPVVFL